MVAERVVAPAASHRGFGAGQLCCRDLFVVRYSLTVRLALRALRSGRAQRSHPWRAAWAHVRCGAVQGQKALALHTDGSIISFSLLLSPPLADASAQEGCCEAGVAVSGGAESVAEVAAEAWAEAVRGDWTPADPAEEAAAAAVGLEWSAGFRGGGTFFEHIGEFLNTFFEHIGLPAHGSRPECVSVSHQLTRRSRWWCQGRRWHHARWAVA
eukprot:SAG11_NODE_90_length_17153_cov_63.471033_9_plen_212_part_00